MEGRIVLINSIGSLVLWSLFSVWVPSEVSGNVAIMVIMTL
jgi:hypothetical protein